MDQTSLLYKVRSFWEAHTNLRNLPHALYIHLVNVQTMGKIFSNFVCFSESPNFTNTVPTIGFEINPRN